MLAIDQVNNHENVQHWQLCGLIMHAFNLNKGLKCTGFDEDDPEPEGDASILNLPNDFLANNSSMMNFRY